MYEFILTERGWLLIWGPPPRPARPVEPELTSHAPRNDAAQKPREESKEAPNGADFI